MTEFLIRKIIKQPENILDHKVREQYGTLSSVVGIACNILLFILKFIMGTIANSISIISDGFNNLSDSASCIVTLFGYKLAAKPADREHPFGHGRLEYLTSLVIAALILVVGIELLGDSVSKIIHPEPVEFKVVVLLSLLFSIGVKFWMSRFNTTLGKKINSSTMLAAAKDSKNDMIATAAAAVSLVVSLFTEFMVDGFIGVFVSAFILKAGFEIIRDTVDELLGKPADQKTVKQIADLIRCDPRIVDVHDMIIHNYGPGNMIGSCHAEVKSDEDFVSAHDLIDRIEHDIYDQLKIQMTIHMDPIEINDTEVNRCRQLVANTIAKVDERLMFHDFRAVIGDTHTNLIFDLVVPYEVTRTNAQLKEAIDSFLAKEPIKYFTVITFDREYIQMD